MEQLKDLRDGQKGVEVEGEVEAVSLIRKVNTKDGPKQVADATIRDETGTIKLSLWGDSIDEVKPGNRVHVTNGYVTTFKGERQINVGRYGKMEVF